MIVTAVETAVIMIEPYKAFRERTIIAAKKNLYL